MPARFYTHSATVLFTRVPTLDEIARVFPSATRRRVRAAAEAPWFGCEDLLVTIDPARNGRLAIDVVAEPWPDGMGDPKRDPYLFGAWSMGAFGARVFPGSLERARAQAWSAREVAGRVPAHVAFVRLRATYVIGAGEDAPVVPEGHSHFVDLAAITRHALRLCSEDGALVYFDPEAEVLLPGDRLALLLDDAERQSRPAIDVYTGVRLQRVEGEHSLVDTVGMERFDQPDIEVPFARATDPNAIVRFVWNLTLHHLQREAPIPAGDTVDGPGGRYRAHALEHALALPPRRAVRFLRDGEALPPALRAPERA